MAVVLMTLVIILSSCANRPKPPEDGIHRTYGESGDLIAIQSYESGQKHGTWWSVLGPDSLLIEQWDMGEIEYSDTVITRPPELSRSQKILQSAMQEATSATTILAKALLVEFQSLWQKHQPKHQPQAQGLLSKGLGLLKDTYDESSAYWIGTENSAKVNSAIEAARLPKWLQFPGAGLGMRDGLGYGISKNADQIREIPEFASEILSLLPELRDSLPIQLARELAELDPELTLMAIKESAQQAGADWFVDFETEMNLSLAKAGVAQEQQVNYYRGYVTGYLTWNLAVDALLSQSVLKLIQTKELSAIQRQRLASVAPHRLPKYSGKWVSGSPGSGRWKSKLKEVNLVTKGRAIRFVKGKPDFSPWCRGGMRFKEGALNGTHDDFNLVYQRLANRRHIKPSQAKRWLKEQGLTIHHLNTREVQFIPSTLHNNIPHIGGAAALRAGG